MHLLLPCFVNTYLFTKFVDVSHHYDVRQDIPRLPSAFNRTFINASVDAHKFYKDVHQGII